MSYLAGGLLGVTKPDFRAIAAFAADHHGVLTLAHSRSFGLTRRQLDELVESGQWLHRYENVYVVASTPPSWKGNLLAACWAGGFRAVASHRSAAAIWGLPAADATFRRSPARAGVGLGTKDCTFTR